MFKRLKREALKGKQSESNPITMLMTLGTIAVSYLSLIKDISANTELSDEIKVKTIEIALGAYEMTTSSICRKDVNNV